MKWGSKHPAETLVEWAAPAVLAGAAGWAALAVTQMPGAAVAAAVGSFLIGFAAIRRVPAEPSAGHDAAFEPVTLEANDDILLLDDPLIEVEPGSQVARLFSTEDHVPGALVARIADYLGDRPERPADPGAEEKPADASAALHAALANIRASLR